MAKAKSNTTERGQITRDRAVAQAIVIADRDGMDSLSMRKLATELGVEAMSLYHHVANKTDILDGMVDVVFTEIGSLPANVPWQDAMRARADAMRAVLRSHPWALGLLESRTTPGSATLQQHDDVLRCLSEAGFSLADAAHALALLDSYIYGFILQEITLPFENSEELVDVADSILAAQAAQAYPYLTEMARGHIMQAGYSFGTEFGYGLELILAGLTSVRAAENAEPPG